MMRMKKRRKKKKKKRRGLWWLYGEKMVNGGYCLVLFGCVMVSRESCLLLFHVRCRNHCNCKMNADPEQSKSMDTDIVFSCL